MIWRGVGKIKLPESLQYDEKKKPARVKPAPV
jgi:hypothetical protein